MRTPQQILKDQTILISGGAGLVAAALIQRLFEPDFKIKKIYTIVRSKPSISAAERLPGVLQSLIGDRLIVLDGDCALPTFGLSDKDWRALVDVDIVIHAAANTKYSPPLPEMLRTVVDLGYYMACFSLAKPNVHVHMHVSSCLVSYNLPNGSIAMEEPFRRSKEAHFNAYFQAKAISEGLVLALGEEAQDGALFRRHGIKCYLPHLFDGTGIVRLPVLGPAIAYPYPGSGSIAAAPVCGLISAHPAPEGVNPHARFDVIPVDTCVDQLIALTASALLSARSPNPVRPVQIYNLAAGIDKKMLVPGSIMLSPEYKIDEPRIPWKVIWQNYAGIINKSVLFDTSRRDAVLGLLTPSSSVHSQYDPQVDCSGLQVDLKQSLVKIDGWPGYFNMVKDRLNEQAKQRKEQEMIANLCDSMSVRESKL